MARKCKEDAEKTRQQIVLAAVYVFAVKGYARATFEQVAARLKLTKGAVYWHFKDKPALLSAVIALALEKRSEALGVPPCGASWVELRDYMVRWSQYIFGTSLGRKFFYVLQFQVEWSSELVESLRTYLKELEAGPYHLIRANLTVLQQRGELRAGTDVEALACVLSGMWFGAMKSYVVDQLSFDLPAALARSFDAVMAEFLMSSEGVLRK